MNKRIIFALLYRDGNFFLSRNFRLQKVGDVNWLKNNFGFGETCHFIDELMIIMVKKSPSLEDYKKYFEDIYELRKNIFVPITLGGGIRNLENAKNCFLNGADKVLINTSFYKDGDLINEINYNYGSQAITLMLDYKIKTENLGRVIFTDCGTKNYHKLNNEIISKISNSDCGEVIINSIDQDGTGAGLDFEALDLFPLNFKKPLLLMGGSGKPEHIKEALNKDQLSGIVTANLFNFLGTGLEISRNMAINSGIKLAKFEKLDLNP